MIASRLENWKWEVYKRQATQKSSEQDDDSDS